MKLSRTSLRVANLIGLLFFAFTCGCEVSKSSSTNIPAQQPANVSPEPPAQATMTVVSEPPPESIIKEKLERDMWGPPSQGGTLHTYQYKSLKIAPSRLGDSLTDGVPANSRTTVHGVKVVVEVTRTFTDGSSKQEVKDQTYVFFKDEFGDWTYRFVQNN